MHGDGDGWVETPIGPRWGRYGAAGLLLYSVNNVGETVILLQHRATWVAQGDTWALPGGARDSHETPTQAALREAWEEAGIPPAGARRQAENHGGGWGLVLHDRDRLHKKSFNRGGECGSARTPVGTHKRSRHL